MTHDQMRELIEKLDHVLEKDDVASVHIFDPDEVAELQRVIAFVRRVDALGWWGKWLFYILAGAAAIIANWERLMQWLGLAP